jgi:Rap1a immunity proteins
MLDPSFGSRLVRTQPTFTRRSGPFDFLIFSDHAPVVEITDVVVLGILVGNIARGTDATRCEGNQAGERSRVTVIWDKMRESEREVRMTKAWLLAVSILFFVVPAFGETTGNDVLDKCQTALRFADNNGAPAGEHFDSGWCFGWVGGALELTKLHNEERMILTEKKPTLLQFCLPDSGIPVIQAVRVVVKYLKEHPAQLHEDGIGLTAAALKDSFPCK